jgi:pyruvate/2-oxoglutarate dehydrogenase complex dihydrolipoamide acyltransferase (E2) component
MSRFSKTEAESLGWKFTHHSAADTVVTSGTQGEVRNVPETNVAEKYVNGTLITEQGETMGKLLERINAYEEFQKRIQPESVEPVVTESNPLNVDEAGLPLRTVSIPADPSDLSDDKEVIQITEEEWAARDRADVLVVRGEDGDPVQVTYGGSSDDVSDAYQAKLDHEAAVENARTALPADFESEQVELDPSELIDAPGATGTGLLIVRAGEESVSEVQERKQLQKEEKENARAIEQAVIGPQGVAPEDQEDLVGTDVAHAQDSDLESEQPRVAASEFEAQKEALEHPEDVEEPGATAEAQEEAQTAASEAVEAKAKEARDDDLATADDAEHVAEAREAGAEALAKTPEDDESGESDGQPEATPAAAELAEEKGVDLTEVEGSGQDGRIVKADVEKAAE